MSYGMDGWNKPSGDSISRAAAIDELRYAQHKFVVADEAGGLGTVKWSENVIFWDAAKRVLEDLPSAKQKQQWIPCSKRLPDLDEDGYSDKVLVSFSNFTGCEICEYRIVDGKGDWYVGDSEERPAEYGIHVNAWMPLPEPYKGGEHETD